MSRNKAKKQSHNSRMRAARARDGALSLKLLTANTFSGLAVGARLRRRIAALPIDMDSGNSLSSPFGALHTISAGSVSRTMAIAKAACAASPHGVAVIDLDTGKFDPV